MEFRKTIISAIFVVSALFLVGCGQKGGNVSAAGGPAPAFPVQVRVAEPKSVGEFTEYIATLKSRDSAVLNPEVEGQITKIFVHSGDHVQPDQPILEIDPRRQQATVNSQQASRASRLATLQLNSTELERTRKLYEAGVVSKQALDQAQSAYDASKADVDALEANVREQSVQLHYYEVKAPAAGVIGDIPVRVGDRVTSTTVLTTLDRGNDLEAYISIPAEEGPRVKVGTPIVLLNDDGEPAAKTSVFFVSPRVDTASQLLLVKARVPAGHGFRNAQLVHARVVWKQIDRPTIPVTAVLRLTGQTFAFVAEKNGNQTVARQRAVQLGEIVGNEYVILNGVKPGEELIVTGIQVLADGMPVAPQPAKAPTQKSGS